MIPATESREILQKRCAKVTGSFKKTLEIAGTWKQYSDRILSGFSGGFLSTSCAFQQEPARNHRKKSENFPAAMLLPQITGIARNRQFPDQVFRPGKCRSEINALLKEKKEENMYWKVKLMRNADFGFS
jgi:hypothetical protein